MPHEIDLLAYLKEVHYSDKEDGIVGYFLLRSEDLENAEDLWYARELFPETAHYRGARFRLTLAVQEHSGQVTTRVDEEESLAEFEAECIDAGKWEDVYQLWGTEAGRPLGTIQLLPERLPAWLGDEGDRCYMTFRMERRPPERSEAELREARETLQRVYENIEERHD